MTYPTAFGGGGLDGGADPVTAGTQRAFERLARYDIFPTLELYEVSDYVGGTLRERLSRAPDRAVELMAEHVAMAVLVRRQYGETELSEEQLDTYLEVAQPFFNSFWHDTP
jgi:hypothetical protein